MWFVVFVYNGNGILVNIDDGGGDGFKIWDIVIVVFVFVVVGMFGGVGVYFWVYFRKCLGCFEKFKVEVEELEEKWLLIFSLLDWYRVDNNLICVYIKCFRCIFSSLGNIYCLNRL